MHCQATSWNLLLCMDAQIYCLRYFKCPMIRTIIRLNVRGRRFTLHWQGFSPATHSNVTQPGSDRKYQRAAWQHECVWWSPIHVLSTLYVGHMTLWIIDFWQWKMDCLLLIVDLTMAGESTVALRLDIFYSYALWNYLENWPYNFLDCTFGLLVYEE